MVGRFLGLPIPHNFCQTFPMRTLTTFLCLTFAVVLFSGVTSARADKTIEEFDGTWVGEGPGDVCFGTSKINFNIKNGVLEGTWYRGIARTNPATLNFNAMIEGSNADSTSYFGKNIHLFKIYGRFIGETVNGTITGIQEPSKCSSVWNAKRIGRGTRKEEELTIYDNSSTTEVETKTPRNYAPLEAKFIQLQRLLDKNLITKEEAAAKRAKLLEDM